MTSIERRFFCHLMICELVNFRLYFSLFCQQFAIPSIRKIMLGIIKSSLTHKGVNRAKEEAKRIQERVLHEERRRVETEMVEEAARKEAFRVQVEASLPPEPMDQGDNIAKIRFRLPKGENLERRFKASTPLKVLFDYLIVKGYPIEEFKVISSWPRRDLTLLDSRMTLLELKLCPQETVILEER